MMEVAERAQSCPALDGRSCRHDTRILHRDGARPQEVEHPYDGRESSIAEDVDDGVDETR